MYFLPAIDLLDGCAVRLARGDYEAVTIYSDDPVAQACRFAEAGASWIHVVDLEGARSGVPAHAQLIKKIVAASGLQVEVGGGIRSIETIESFLRADAARVVLGTALVRDPAFVREALQRFGADRLCAGIDAKAGRVAIQGWQESSEKGAYELAREMGELGFSHMVCTDIARDGMQSGVDGAAYQEISEAFGSPVIVSGGISCADDIGKLASVASFVEGVISGRAIYEKTLTVEAGVAACNKLTRGAETGMSC